MDHVIVPRDEIGVPDPGSRRKLGKVSSLVVHYTGVHGYDDPEKDWEYARKVALYGKAAGKAWEYNYLIGLGGEIFEQAGDRMAAHCLNANTWSYGVMLMNGIDVPMTFEQIMAFHWLTDVLHWVQALDADAEIVPHYHYRSTGCPGTKIADVPGKAITTVTGEGRDGKVNGYLAAA